MKLTLDIPYFSCPPNMTLHLEHILEGEYEVPIAGQHLHILDIGANCGAFSVWAAHRFSHCTISAYEPNPACLPYLSHNTQNLPVEINKWGIGVSGMRPLFDGKNNLGEASLFSDNSGVTETGRHVEIRDPLTLPEADILKIDTEGAEIEIIQPLIEAGRSFMAVMFEYHSVNDRRTLDLLLGDYTLIGAEVYSAGRGIMKYIHSEMVQR